MALRPYSSAYKPSGVKWLGETPAHWEIHRLKSSTVNVVDQTVEHDHGDLCIALEQVESWTGRFREAGTNVAFDSQMKRFRADDVLLGKLRPYLAKVVRPARDGLCVGEFLVLRPRNGAMDAGYLEHILRSKPVIDAIASSTYGARMPRADWQFIGSMEYPHPPSDEQAAIVRFLDHLDRRIRRYISAKERFVELLTEQKEAIINQAVTRGLEPNVPFKASGIDYIGDVPAHWKVMPIKRAFSSMDYGISQSATDTGSVRLLTMGHISDGRVAVPSSGGVEWVADSLLLQNGDLLFNRTNSQELVGKVGLFTGHDTPVTFASYLVRLRPSRQHRAEYLNVVLNDSKILSGVRREAIPSLHQSNLNPTRYGRIQIPLPPLTEQNIIWAHLKRVTNGINSSIKRARRQIKLMQEYRTRLIADVVTGKLDVRGATGERDRDADLVATGSQQLDLDLGR